MMLKTGTDSIQIVTVADDRFAQHLGVMLTSLFENSSSDNSISVFVIDGGISPLNKERLDRLAGKYRATLNFLPVNKDIFKGLGTRGYLNYSTYYRLAIPDLLDQSIDKVLYLDCDLVIKRDIRNLWAVDVSRHYLAAVEDTGVEYFPPFNETKNRLNIPGSANYFNSGVMLINLSRWREDTINHKIIDFVTHNPDKCALCDQDGLNAILFDKWLPLPIQWNVQTYLFELIKTKQDPEFINAVNKPYIIHFTGETKPGDYKNEHPLKNEYFNYLALTEWNPGDVSVILPALDEERTIGKCITKIQKVFLDHAINGEIIVVDSSSDRTAEISRMLGAIVIPAEKKGYGNAYLTGFKHAKCRFIVMGDGDDTYDFLEIPRLISPLKEAADFVIGSRFKGTIHKGAMTPLHQYIGNPLLTLMINFIFRTQFSDAHSGFRAITREALGGLQLKTGGMEFASEMLVMASKEQLKIVEVPIDYYPRLTPSKLHSFADGWRHIRFVLLMKPLPFVAIPGLIFSLIGLLLMSFFYFQGNIESSHLHAFIMSAIFIIGGVQVILMGFLMKTYSVIHGYENKQGIIELVMKYHSLEIFLVLGFLLVSVGVLLGLNIFLRWVSTNYGALSEISTAIISLVLIVTGIQIFLFAVFQSMMLLNENNNHD
jgi:lipopolysaccharide biosynthesis glycosyltransferase